MMYTIYNLSHLVDCTRGRAERFFPSPGVEDRCHLVAADALRRGIVTAEDGDLLLLTNEDGDYWVVNVTRRPQPQVVTFLSLQADV